MKKIKTERESKVFVFGHPYITECSVDENSLFFINSIDPLSIPLKEASSYFDKSTNFFYSNFDKVLKEVKHNKVIYAKLISIIAITLLLASNPTSCFAMSFVEKMSIVGKNLIDILSVGMIKGVLILTVLRLFNEYTRGCSDCRVFEILKESLAIILAVIVIPKLPVIISSFIG